MPCSKTGFHGLVEPYGEYVYGDAYQRGGLAWFRIVERSFTPLAPTIHYTIHDYDCWFDQTMPTGKNSTLITDAFTNHGYDGIPVVMTRETTK